MPFHSNDTATIPYTFKSLPKKLMEESNKVDNKFLNNHLGEIEEAVDKKLLNKIPFIKQQKKYHESSGVLNHDNFFHCDLATGTPISNDGFRHSQFMINSYTEAGGCTPGEELEMFGNLGGYGNRADNTVDLSYTPAMDGVIGECYDQIAVDCDNTTDNIILGAYDFGGTNPDNLLSETASLPRTADYAYRSLPEFELTTVEVWLGYVSEAYDKLREYEVLSGGDHVASIPSQSYPYGPLPDPSGLTGTHNKDVIRLKINHT